MSRCRPLASPLKAVTFPSPLGWMALAMSGRTLHGLTFGHDSPRDALDHLRRVLDDGDDWDVVALGAVDVDDVDNVDDVVDVDNANDANDANDAAGRLAKRLQAYAAGSVDDFLDVPVVHPKSAFQRAVIRHCRRIPYAATLTYGELAARAGSPRAARAVGNIMARNRTPLVVPCHRVVGADGRLCGYSAGEGTRTKLRLLEQEALCAGAAHQ